MKGSAAEKETNIPMARTFETTIFPAPVPDSVRDAVVAMRFGGIFFRTLVDLGTGDVAGIESVRTHAIPYDAAGRALLEHTVRFEALPAIAPQARPARKAAYLVRCDLALRVGRLAASFGIAPEHAILMFDVGALCRDPGRALDLLLDCKRAGARILLDNFDLEDPPARFMEMLPADILRVAPRSMPWHWEAAKRRDLLASLLAFAGNLLMDVAVEDVSSGWQRREYKRLGVRYIQGGWCRDMPGRAVSSPSR